jgi:hypothetical protein
LTVSSATIDVAVTNVSGTADFVDLPAAAADTSPLTVGNAVAFAAIEEAGGFLTARIASRLTTGRSALKDHTLTDPEKRVRDRRHQAVDEQGAGEVVADNGGAGVAGRLAEHDPDTEYQLVDGDAGIAVTVADTLDAGVRVRRVERPERDQPHQKERRQCESHHRSTRAIVLGPTGPRAQFGFSLQSVATSQAAARPSLK